MATSTLRRSLPYEARRPLGLSLEEQFTRTFDIYPFEASLPPPAVPTAGKTATAAGFGSAAPRFQDQVYGSNLNFGLVNKVAVIELGAAEPVPVPSLAASAPSRLMPEYASTFEPELGRNFQRGVDRSAPPGSDGSPMYFVQAKDAGGVFPGADPPDIFAMPAPRGAGSPSRMHEGPDHMMTPAERREALVFDKCHQRARLALRKAANDACQLTRKMQIAYPNGVLGVEGPACADSLIYRAPHARAKAREEAHADHARRRAENLSTKSNTQLSHNFMHFDPKSSAVERMFTSKGAVAGYSAQSRELSHYELRPSRGDRETAFRSNQEKPLRDPAAADRRTQNLVNALSNGRDWDVISGVRPPLCPSIPPRDISRRAHESNFAMPLRVGTAPTLVGPIPDAHRPLWKPPSPQKSPSAAYLS